MATVRNLFRYHVNSMVALSDRKKLQDAPLNPWEFNFPDYGAKAYVWDNVEVREIRLHAGLRIIMVIEGTYSANIQGIAASTINGILDILSFTTSAQCDLPMTLPRFIGQY